MIISTGTVVPAHTVMPSPTHMFTHVLLLAHTPSFLATFTSLLHIVHTHIVHTHIVHTPIVYTYSIKTLIDGVGVLHVQDSGHIGNAYGLLDVLVDVVVHTELQVDLAGHELQHSVLLDLPAQLPVPVYADVS